MKRRLIYNVVGVLAMLLMMGACQEEDWGNQVSDINCLTLELSTTAASRVPVVGDDRFNENEVERVDVYFFADGGSGNCLYAQTGLVPEGSVLQVVLDKNRIQDNNTYYIYVVANCDLGITNEIAVNYTLDGLKDIIVSTQWKNGTNTDDAVESSLVMDGNSSVKVTAEGAEGHVILVRAMAKVMLYTSTEKELTVNGMTYTPVPERMFVTMYNSVTKTNLEDDYQVNSSADYLTGGIRRNYDAENPEEVPAKEIDEDADEDAEPYNRYEQVAPFYSYPNPQETTDRKDTYLILCVPWTVRQSDGDGSYQAVNYYYRVPITGNADPALMARNQYYRINVHISVLGSVDPEDAIEITNANFEIYDWFEVGIDTGMEQYQYLVLDEYSSVMNNVDELEMPYISSSPIDWSPNEDGETNDGFYTVIESVRYMDYHQTNSYSVVLTDQHQWDSEHYENQEDAIVRFSDFELGPGDAANTIKIKHILDDSDYVKYTITIAVYNTQGVRADTWTIDQYPAIYIEGELATDRLYVAGYYTTYKWGFDKDQWYRDVTYDGNDLGSVQNPESVDGSANNRNPNNYNIYISSFDVGDNYAIGDPRSDIYNNLEMEGLTQYYPSRQTLSGARVIAPAFKIASSRGKTMPVSFDNAQRRCAAYQESGYPAGRWRIPTEAEIEFIVSLSEDGKIPTLFGGDYWSASGRYYSSSDENFYPQNVSEDYKPEDDDEYAVRCVYDIWYWGEQDIEHDEFNTSRLTNNDFVWGDAASSENPFSKIQEIELGN